MSKTVDDLVMVFEKARAEAAPFPQHHEDGLYAGIAAVVRALRDEVINKAKAEPYLDVGDVIDVINEILGDTAEARSAGVLAVESREGAMISEAPEAPATAPAPAVCVWTPQDEGPAHEIWKTGCGTMYERAKSTGWCGKCKAPIKFTEAKT